LSNRVTISEQMLVSAVRYALGRATYIVGATVDEVLRVWPKLSENARHVIRRDVTEALSEGRTGMECDELRWHELIAQTRD